MAQTVGMPQLVNRLFYGPLLKKRFIFGQPIELLTETGQSHHRIPSPTHRLAEDEVEARRLTVLIHQPYQPMSLGHIEPPQTQKDLPHPILSSPSIISIGRFD